MVGPSRGVGVQVDVEVSSHGAGTGQSHKCQESHVDGRGQRNRGLCGLPGEGGAGGREVGGKVWEQQEGVWARHCAGLRGQVDETLAPAGGKFG